MVKMMYVTVINTGDPLTLDLETAPSDSVQKSLHMLDIRTKMVISTTTWNVVGRVSATGLRESVIALNIFREKAARGARVLVQSKASPGYSATGMEVASFLKSYRMGTTLVYTTMVQWVTAAFQKSPTLGE